MLHPCQRCGACCASLRVSFRVNPHGTPAELMVSMGGGVFAMAGTEKKHSPKCCSLRGTIGENAQCSIYELRPPPCREFEASFERGHGNYRCDQARANHGLPPLSGQDWKEFRGAHPLLVVSTPT